MNSREERFWQWFISHQEEIYSHDGPRDPILDDLLSVLHEYNEELFFEVSPKPQAKELVITAEGNEAHFADVEKLISAAPLDTDWKFIAFKPAMGFDFETCYEGVNYPPSKFWFLPLTNKSNPYILGIRVGIPEYNDQKHADAIPALYIIVDTAIGEKVAAEIIKHIEVCKLPEQPESEGYIELVELGKYIEWFKSDAHNKSLHSQP